MTTSPLSKIDTAAVVARHRVIPRTHAVPVLGVDGTDDEWKALRREGMGASELSAVLGVSPNNSAFALWWQKMEGWEIESTLEMDIGTWMEPVIRECFARQFPDAMLFCARARVCARDRKSTRVNSSHLGISYAV